MFFSILHALSEAWVGLPFMDGIDAGDIAL